MKYREILYKAIPVLLLLAFTWVRASSMFGRLTDPDPGLFEAFAYHIQQGKILYADIWDHKPPGIFYLNLVFIQLFGATEDAISYGSMFFCLLQTLVAFYLLKRISNHIPTAFVGTLIFIICYYSYPVFGSGNYTEQYGVLCTSAALLWFLKFRESQNKWHLWASGAAFGISIWFKEPFLVSAVPVGLALFYFAIRDKKQWIFLFQFCIAFALPALIISNTLAFTGSWHGYKEHLLHSKQYAIQSQWLPFHIKMRGNFESFFGPGELNQYPIFIMWLVGCFVLIYQKRTRFIGILMVGQQLLDYLGTGISGNRFFHYYMQSFPLTIIIFFSGFSEFITSIKPKILPMAKVLLPLILLMYIVKVQKPWMEEKWTPNKNFKDPIVEYLNNNEFTTPRSIAMGGKDIGFYLLRARGISEIRYAVPYPYHWIKIPGKKEKYKMYEHETEFKNWMPEYVIYSGTFAEMYNDIALDSFVLKNYSEVAMTEFGGGANAHLLKKNVAPIEQ
jgi:4-amino-4-deoxy-L-arabinose transferase-like glycosyltransferase